ncbi:cutinase family protein [Nocardia farcinica]|uniref:cutinase family protein n=1 Tax=Nocardia farcinica TaxID=37329 RepID=UPI0018930831|nr:cutinase family protein [Nocardia farcinica]MBF6422663.1 cutinase family protein [Nocardia farcinica]MBF6434353.1 cutinase family protein [Nocardia farcinica]MBF6505438.1 cutinase family protein [Nocardia farcinica]
MRQRSIRHRAVTAAVTATVAAAGAAACLPGVASAAPAGTPAGCAETFNLFIPGTWETSESADPATPVGMLAPVAEAIKRENGGRAEVYTLPYMARAFDNGYTYADSKSTAINNATAVLRDYAAKCRGTKFTITGYSQGADAAGDLASAIGNGRGPVPADRVLAVGLLADPGSGTKGEAVVGPRGAGKGIADPRPMGMGALSGRVASICDPKDLYCSVSKGNNPLLGQLGSILSKTPSSATSTTSSSTTSTTATGVPGAATNAQLASALTTDFSRADLPGMATAVGDLVTGLTQPNGTINLQQVASSANKLLGTLTSLTDLVTSGTADAATGTLSSAPTGSPEHNANQVLSAAGRSDLTGALSTVQTIADTAADLMGTNTNTLAANSPDAATLSSAATTLNGQVAPLASTPADILGSASSVLSVLKPSTMVNQALNVVTNVTAIDFPRILNLLTVLPQKVAALDAHGAHQVAGELNNAFQPLVKLAAGVDLKWISSILAIIPDPAGYTQIAALVTSILANVDIIRLANLVGQIQEVAWAAIEKLLPPPGQAPDPLGAGAALTGLLPIGLDLASVAVNMLTGKAQKTPPELLGKQSNTAATTISKQAQNLDLNGLTGSLMQMASSQGADDLVTLINDGLSAASFYASGAHQNYNSLVVDNAGRNAIQWLSDWLNLQIGRAV